MAPLLCLGNTVIEHLAHNPMISAMTLNTTAFGIMAFGITAFGITAFGIMAFGIKAFSITTFGITTQRRNIQHKRQ